MMCCCKKKRVAQTLVLAVLAVVFLLYPLMAGADSSVWTPMTSGTTKELFDVWGTSSTDVFAVGSGGTIVHYNGNTWSTMTSGTIQHFYGVWGTSSSDIFAVGTGGTIIPS